MEKVMKNVKVMLNEEFGNVRFYDMPNMTETQRKEFASIFGQKYMRWHRTEKYWYTERNSFNAQTFVAGCSSLSKKSWFKDNASFEKNPELKSRIKELAKIVAERPIEEKKTSAPKVTVAPQNASPDFEALLKSIVTKLDSIDSRLNDQASQIDSLGKELETLKAKKSRSSKKSEAPKAEAPAEEAKA